MFIGQGMSPKSAFNQAIGQHPRPKKKTVVLDVSGNSDATAETIKIATEHFVGNELWVVHRTTDSELVRVTLILL